MADLLLICKYLPVIITIRTRSLILKRSFRIEEVVTKNCWGCPRNASSVKSEGGLLSMGGDPCSGLWLRASKPNHSCIPNINRSFIGDFIVIRATADIPPNTELAIWYKSPEYIDPNIPSSFQTMDERFGVWGFKCTCPVCEEARNLPKDVLKKRNELIAAINKFCNNYQNGPKIEAMIPALEKTYSQPPTVVPRISLAGYYTAVSGWYNKVHHNVSKTRYFALKSFECLGYEFNDATRTGKDMNVTRWGVDSHTYHIWCQLFFAHTKSKTSSLEAFKKTEAFLRLSYKIEYGEDVTFEENYLKVTKQEWISAVQFYRLRKTPFLSLPKND